MTTKTQKEIDLLDKEGLDSRLATIHNKVISELDDKEVQSLFPEILYIQYKQQRLTKETNEIKN